MCIFLEVWKLNRCSCLVFAADERPCGVGISVLIPLKKPLFGLRTKAGWERVHLVSCWGHGRAGSTVGDCESTIAAEGLRSRVS